MSLDHQNQSEISHESEKYTFDEILKNEEKSEFYKWQMNNIYNVEKHYTPHDIIGTKGLVQAQNEELDTKKVLIFKKIIKFYIKIKFRYENELYLRNHPELNVMISCFLFKVLEEKPSNILSYAGNFFDQLKYFFYYFFKFYYREKLKEIIDIEKKHYIDNS